MHECVCAAGRMAFYLSCSKTPREGWKAGPEAKGKDQNLDDTAVIAYHSAGYLAYRKHASRFSCTCLQLKDFVPATLGEIKMPKACTMYKARRCRAATE